MFRTSYTKGFRAPTLQEMYSPKSVTNTAATYNDPVLCPGGVPATGSLPARDCGMQFDRQNGGNKDLEPEK
ncbi:TonB-dependent receptor, partial [Streptococcus pneumoniae]|nr:TonB-dependent receptor [Streptococcus pneumoniae]